MPIDTVTQASANVRLQWNVKSAVAGTVNGVSSNEEVGKNFLFTLGNGAAQLQQIIALIQEVGASANVDVDLAASLTNVVNEQNAVLIKIKLILFQLLSTADDSTNGSDASQVIIKASAVNGTPLFMQDNSDAFRLNNGGLLAWGDSTTGGITITNSSADSINIANQDGVETAKVRIVLFGDIS